MKHFAYFVETMHFDRAHNCWLLACRRVLCTPHAAATRLNAIGEIARGARFEAAAGKSRSREIDFVAIPFDPRPQIANKARARAALFRPKNATHSQRQRSELLQLPLSFAVVCATRVFPRRPLMTAAARVRKSF